MPGKWVCDAFRLAAMRACLVYSIGSKGRFEFEEGVLAVRPDCEIHTFDPTSRPPMPGSSAAAAGGLHFHAVGLGARDGTLPLGGVCGEACPVRALPALIRELGHEAAIIDLLKIDVEGSEYDALTDVLFSCQFPLNVRQIQIELHTKGFLNWNVQRLMLGLAHAGYTLFHKEANTLAGGACYEFSFVRTLL